MKVSSFSDGIPQLQSMENSNSVKIPQGDTSFKSLFQVKDLQEKSDKSKCPQETMQKLQGFLFQHFIKSILPEETSKSLGGGFNGDFWQDILAENISYFIVKQQKINLNLSEKSK
ncbi:hypothetical protein [Candidatus Liberibacter brunswickensis]|uniref:hypothetical protein n=1 Tax=Candidatus Liberibacter brunswickensis TaxID=1968796 RepID=UPI002FE4194F